MRIKCENRIDLYRGTPIIEASSEHVVQAGLGGQLEVEGLIDRTTNARFGGTIDRAITESLALIRSMIDLRTRRGEPIYVGAESGEYDIRGNVPVKKKSKKVPWTAEERQGEKIITITAGSMEQAATLVKHALRAHGAPGAEQVRVSASKICSYVPKIHFKVNIAGSVGLRAVAKSCVNALAICLTPSRVLNGPFQKIRDYILYGVDHYDELLNGETDPWPKFACWDNRAELFSVLPEECNLGPFDHRLVIRACGGTNTVYSTFELFGYVSVSVLLSDTWAGEDFCWGLITDPRPKGNGCWRGELDLKLRPALSADTVMEHTTDVTRLKSSFDKLFVALSEFANDRATYDLITESLLEALGPLDGRPLTEEMLNLFVSNLAKKFIEREYRLESKTSIKLPPDLLPPESKEESRH